MMVSTNTAKILLVGSTLDLIAHVEIERVEGDLLSGCLFPGPDFTKVAPLFKAWEDAVENQCLPLVDELDQRIGQLGLAITLPELTTRYDLFDFQVWNDNRFTCRLVHGSLGPVKNALETLLGHLTFSKLNLPTDLPVSKTP